MDPNAALREIASFFAELQEKVDDCPDEGASVELDPYELADVIAHWDGLNQWLCKGGFLPEEWKR